MPEVNNIQDPEIDGRIYSFSDNTDYGTTDKYDKDFNTVSDFGDLQNEEIGDKRIVGKSSSFFASYNVICTVVGTGLLQLPYGLYESGWIGVFLLLGMCAIATYTATILIKCMNPPSGRKLYTYSEIGIEAFGKWGGYVVDIMLHATLIGVATIYLILAGGNLSYLLNSIPWKAAGADANYIYSLVDINPHWCFLIIAIIVWGHVWLGTLHEVGFMSAFNVLVAIFLFLVVIIEVLINIPEDRGEHEFLNSDYYGLSLAGAFVSFAFSYGAHAILPTVYETMKKPQQFNIMIGGTFIAILGFYIPMAIVGYYAYGDATVSPIYDNLCDSNGGCNYGQQLGKWLAVFAVTAHVMLSFAIVINPTELALERFLKIDDKFNNPKRKLISVSLRTGLVLVTVITAEIIPDFGDFLNLVSACTNTATSFVFPCLFYLVLFWPSVKKNYLIIGINIGIIGLTTIAGFFGAVFAIISIMCHVFGFAIVSSETCTPLFSSSS